MLPLKILVGDGFGIVRERWNFLIDYLASERLTAGPGIRLQRTPSGTVISSTREGGASPAAAPSGGDEYDGEFAVSLGSTPGTVVVSAGHTDIVPGVPETVVNVAGFTYGSRPTYAVKLCGAYDETAGTYSVYFSNDLTAPGYWLANFTLSDGIVTGVEQAWTGGSIYFGERYLV